MIRIKFELVPDGLDQFAQEASYQIMLACKFPLRDEHQDLYVLTETRRALITDFDLKANLYRPLDGHPKLELLFEAATNALKAGAVPIGPGEIFPGSQTLPADEIEKKLEKLKGQVGSDLISIKLIGRRAGGDITAEDFEKGYAAFNENSPSRDSHAGNYILKNHPDYVPYMLAVELRPDIYSRPYGQQLEELITGSYTLRTFERVPLMRCYNGLTFFFLRPGGQVSHMIKSLDITDELPGMELLGSKQAARVIRAVRNGPNKILFKRMGSNPQESRVPA